MTLLQTFGSGFLDIFPYELWEEGLEKIPENRLLYVCCLLIFPVL